MILQWHDKKFCTRAQKVVLGPVLERLKSHSQKWSNSGFPVDYVIKSCLRIFVMPLHSILKISSNIKMDHLDLPNSPSAFSLRPSKSVPSVLPIAHKEAAKVKLVTDSVDSLFLVVVDQVQSWFCNKTGPPPNHFNKSDLTFLLDSEGGGGLCFQALCEQENSANDAK